MGWNTYLQPKQQQQNKQRLYHQLLYRIVALLIVISILIVIYFQIWSTTGIFFAASPIGLVTTKPSHHVNEDGVEEQHDADSVELVLLSSCLWDPLDSNTSCTDLLSQHISTSLIRSRQRFLLQQELSYNENQRVPSVLHRRWLLFGDSTMVRLLFQLNQYLMVESVERYTNFRSTQICSRDNVNADNIIDLQFSHQYVGRCDRMEQFQLSRLPANKEWQLPNYSIGEGPLLYGLNNPYCTDCSGCDSEVISCTVIKVDKTDRCTDPNDSNPVASYIGPSYGGFLSVEFARDVELQTSEYSTTQENLIPKYIANQWNKPIELVYDFGRPICLVSTGHHDVSVPNMTLAIYLENVHWYLELLVQQCDYIVWISNNAPATNDYEQTIDGTYEWNMAVFDLLLHSDGPIRTNVFFLDVFNASITYAKDDNIHMSPLWYKALASFLQTIMQNLVV